MTDLRRQWLEDAEADCRRKARKTQAEYELLQDKTTSYARAIDALSRAHDDASIAYASWQEPKP